MLCQWWMRHVVWHDTLRLACCAYQPVSILPCYDCMLLAVPGAGCCRFMALREECRDRALRDPDYDSHLGLERDPETREIVTVAQHT